MKIIFLDIDGPLAWETENEGSVKIPPISIPYPWIQEECDALTEIIKRTGAEVVISSDWRKYYTTDEIGMMFKRYGIPNVIVGATHEKKTKLSSSLSHDRAKQILDWLDATKKKVDSWIAIDDFPLGKLFTDPENHLQLRGDWSNSSEKLSENVEKVIAHLNKKSKKAK